VLDVAASGGSGETAGAACDRERSLETEDTETVGARRVLEEIERQRPLAGDAHTYRGGQEGEEPAGHPGGAVSTTFTYVCETAPRSDTAPVPACE
jgi:hypothetical protein